MHAHTQIIPTHAHPHTHLLKHINTLKCKKVEDVQAEVYHLIYGKKCTLLLPLCFVLEMVTNAGDY